MSDMPVFNTSLDGWTVHRGLKQWVIQMICQCEPGQVHLVEGSDEENQSLLNGMVESHTLIPLNPHLRPHSYLALSDPADVARVEERTFICSANEIDSGPTNNWRDPDEMRTTLSLLLKGCMKGRTMYVIPFCMGPLYSSLSRVGVQITDSAYVVCNMRMMTRIGKEALQFLGEKEFVKCLHSVGKPLSLGEKDVAWPCNPQKQYIAHFPDTREICSYGSGYGGNALLGKKCFALRIASVLGKEEGWFAEHMLIVGVTNPEGIKKYFAASFPSACGKTNLAMLMPSLPGWKIECVGDDIAWMQWKEDGKLYAINPEAGFFGVAPGTSYKSNPHAMKTLCANSLFTNVALTEENDVWWEGMTEHVPDHLTDWKGHLWHSNSTEKAAHPNARFTVCAKQCPVIDPDWENPQGVLISGIIFGGRRSSTVPLVREALSWQHGVFLGASMSSETTAAAAGELGKLRHDPFAMLPFCGYNMADYFQHWLSMGSQRKEHSLPSIFYVNWFKKDQKGKWLWPGFGENIRVLKWIFGRTEKTLDARQTPIGWLPYEKDLDLSGLNMSYQSIDQLLNYDPQEWLLEAEELERYFQLFGSRLPDVLKQEVAELKNSSKIAG